MTTVNTIRGPVELDQLGRVLMHEHVFTLNAEIRDEYPWNEAAAIQQAIAELNDLKARGIDSIVDLTVFGLGRNIRRVQRIAEEVDLHIIPATGIYTYRDLPTYFRANEERNPGFIEDFFVREIESGIDDTGVRPAILKVAVDHYGVTPELETLLRATARAHRRTGVPISTHADALSEQGLHQQRIFAEEGVDLERVIIGHVGDAQNLDYAEKLIAAGSTVGADRLGIGALGAYTITAQERIAVVADLVARGHAGKVVLGHDTHVRSDSIDRTVRDGDLPDWNYAHVTETVIPRLLELGVDEADIDLMLVENPRRLLGHAGPY